MPKCATKLAKAKGLFCDFLNDLVIPFTGKVHCVPPQGAMPFKLCIVLCYFRVSVNDGVVSIQGSSKCSDAYTVIVVPPATMNMIDLCGHSPAWTS
jgi:hypothetical protein